MKKHRNTQKRIHIPDTSYFCTTNTGDWFPYFKEPIFCDVFVEELRLSKFMRGYLLLGWIICYDHFHGQIQPGDNWNYSDVIHFLKRNSSRNINYILGYNKSDESNNNRQPEGEDDQSTRPPEGEDDHPRLLRELNKLITALALSRFIRIKLILKTRFKIKYLNGHNFPKFAWQSSFFDHFARNYDDFEYHQDYIIYNIDKHGLPENWPYIFTNPKFYDLTNETQCIKNFKPPKFIPLNCMGSMEI